MKTPHARQILAWIGLPIALASCDNRAYAQPSTNETVRFLEEATFGPNPSLIAHVQSVGFSAFLDEQFALPASSYPNLPLQPTTTPSTCTGTCVRDNYTMYPLQVTFFKNGLPDLINYASVLPSPSNRSSLRPASRLLSQAG